MKNSVVKWTMLFLTLGIIGWDIYLAVGDDIPGNTISANLTRWAIDHPWSMYLLTFVLVGLLWHWYRGRPIPVEPEPIPGALPVARIHQKTRRRKLILGALALLATGALGMAFVELIGFY